MIVAGGVAVAVGLDAVVKTMGGMGGSVSLIDVREVMCTRRGDVDRRVMRRSRSWGRRELRTRSNMRTSNRSVALTLFMTPFSAIVTSAMKGRPERLRRMRCLWSRTWGGEDTRGERMMRRRSEGEWMKWRRTMDVGQKVGP